MKNKDIILKRCEKILKKYKGFDNIYYKELNKSYKEFKKTSILDKHTYKLYEEHILSLCDMVEDAKRSLPVATILFIIFIVIVCISTFSVVNYYDHETNLKNNIIKMNSGTKITVDYKNINDFNAFSLIANSEYLNLDPLNISLNITSDKGKNYLVHYDVYIIPDNDGIKEEDLINKDVFLYNIKSETKNSDIQSLMDKKEKDGRILLFSNEVKTNMIENLELRMWIDNNTDIDYKHKKYRFKFYVDGYVI